MTENLRDLVAAEKAAPRVRAPRSRRRATTPADDGYNDVASRVAEFRDKYPDGWLRPANPHMPYRLERIGDQTYVVYVGAAYRTPDDPLPGIGSAWERVPGLTEYTEGSELQNAETAAWGRAMVAALAADTRAGVASRDEVTKTRPPSKPRARKPKPHVETPPPAETAQ